MSAIDTLKSRGYDVGVATVIHEDHADPDSPVVQRVYRVAGYGIDVMVNETGAEESWDSLLDAEAHDERVAQFEAPDPEPDDAPVDPAPPTLADLEERVAALEADAQTGGAA